MDKASITVWFQSTPPREGRLAWGNSSVVAWEFQSTPPREGRPEFAIPEGTTLDVSIHAPA